jgi:predicted acyl esterase
VGVVRPQRHGFHGQAHRRLPGRPLDDLPRRHRQGALPQHATWKRNCWNPGKVVELDIDLGYIAIVLAPGHRLRVAISSSNFDRWDINPNTGEPYGEHALTQSLLAERLASSPSPRNRGTRTAWSRPTPCSWTRSRPSHVLLPIPVEERRRPPTRRDSAAPSPRPISPR